MKKQIFQQDPAGITDLSKEFFQEHRTQIGDIERVTMITDYQKADYEVSVFGTEGTIIMDGFACGYYGEGPRGFLWLLHQCGFNWISMESIASVETSRTTYALPKMNTAPDYRWHFTKHLFCDVCQCHILISGWDAHRQTQKHKRNTEKRNENLLKQRDSGLYFI